MRERNRRRRLSWPVAHDWAKEPCYGTELCSDHIVQQQASHPVLHSRPEEARVGRTTR